MLNHVVYWRHKLGGQIDCCRFIVNEWWYNLAAPILRDTLSVTFFKSSTHYGGRSS